MAELDHSWSRKVKDTAAGFVGGVTQVLIGQPADLVKVRLQTSATPQTSIDVIKHVFKNEGLLAFYKGTLPPLLGVGACVSLQFYGFYESKRQMLKLSGVQELNLWPQTYIAGACAGIINTPVTAPMEQLRILSQADASVPRGSLTQTIKHIYASAGVRTGLFRGFSVTLLRETQAYGVWFLTYEYLIDLIRSTQRYSSRDQIPTVELLAAGAIAGDALWLSSYPLDVIKSNVQSDGFGAASRFRGSALAATSHIWRTHGFAGFWKGLTPCLIRAIPCSAGTFASVELALRVMG